VESIEVCAEPELMIFSGLHKIFGNLVLLQVIAELETIA